MRTLKVDLGERSYPIFIGERILGSSECLLPYIKGRQVCIVTNETIAPLYLQRLIDSLTGLQVDVVILPDGEAFKTLTTLNQIFTTLLERRHNRTTTLIALGGGVVGDMTGFAAASYQRGVDFIQVPTTLLSQVDSSVGGKTGVNHALGKNMIGAFHQPNAVLIDTLVLSSLPKRELAAGFAEVVKYGLISDQPFFCWLEANVERIMSCEPEALAYAVEQSCLNKAAVVAQDEKEGGVRAILNLGHTFGHAIETAQGYGNWLHGEAVATGMLMALDLSCREGWLPAEVLERARALLLQASLPVKAPEDMSAETFVDLMAVDKKVLDGELRLVLMTELGKAVVTKSFSMSNLHETLAAF